MEAASAAAPDRLGVSRLPAAEVLLERRLSTDPLGVETSALDIIDGQQRIIAMTQFRQDEWPLLEPDKLPLPPAVKREPARGVA